MKRDTLILVIALASGLAAFSLILNFLKQAAQPEGQYVMAIQDLTKGKVLAAADLGISPPLKNIPAESFFTQMHDALGMEIQEDIPKGRLIARELLKEPPPPPPPSPSPDSKSAKKKKPREIVLPVPPSMRALTLSAQELENIPQGLTGGNYVDILGSIALDDRQKEVRTVLSGIQILAVERNENKIETVTIALLPNQVETLLNVSRMAKMRLVIGQEPPVNGKRAGVGTIEIIRGIVKEQKVT